ncbi:MAG: hypothetical protein KJI72_01925 [Patescibacteria group bacterium]|nr:hypothetical protein [Patescibacteria group bacterium]
MKKFLVAFIVLGISYSLLAASANAQSAAVQEAFENVEDQVEDLVIAKDENIPDDLAFRIETFKEVVDFSILEAKDLKIKLLSLDQIEEDASSWKEERIKDLNRALVHYDEQKQLIDDSEVIDLETIKNIASDFKDWREQTYLPAAEQVNEFLLVEQEQNAVNIAERRWQRIDKDITKLQEANLKGVSGLRELLDKAGELIEESDEINQAAENLFFDRYIYTNSSTSSSTATTTEITDETEDQTIIHTEEVSDEPDSTGTEADATDVESVPPPPLSIKDLVRTSLTKIKEAYRIFIEMSNSVRELLS